MTKQDYTFSLLPPPSWTRTTSLTTSSYLPYPYTLQADDLTSISHPCRCRQEERRVPQSLPQMTVLEIVEEEEPGRVTVVEDEHAGTFAIKVPHQYKRDKPKCNSNEIYVSEVDL